MTLNEYTERTRQLCNLVNVRRTQVGREPLQHARIMRTVRRCFGAGPPLMFENRSAAYREPRPLNSAHSNPKCWIWDETIPYALTRKALNYLIASQI